MMKWDLSQEYKVGLTFNWRTILCRIKYKKQRLNGYRKNIWQNSILIRDLQKNTKPQQTNGKEFP